MPGRTRSRRSTCPRRRSSAPLVSDGQDRALYTTFARRWAACKRSTAGFLPLSRAHRTTEAIALLDSQRDAFVALRETAPAT